MPAATRSAAMRAASRLRAASNMPTRTSTFGLAGASPFSSVRISATQLIRRQEHGEAGDAAVCVAEELTRLAGGKSQIGLDASRHEVGSDARGIAAQSGDAAR